MHGFDDVTLSWQGQSFTVPANNQMMLIAKIEDALGGEGGQQAMTVLFRREGPPMSRLAMAFGAALRHAGAKVSDEDVYLSMQTDLVNKSKKAQLATIQNCIFALLSIISPPAVAAMNSKADDTEKKD